MKLEGLVEDVHLDEVLRVLAFSGRSGTLHVQGPDDSGFLTLNAGQAVAVRVDSDRCTVAELLVTADLVSHEALDELPDARRRQPIPECFSDLLVVAPELDEDSRAVLEKRLRELIFKLIRVPRGRFSFNVANEPPTVPCYLGDQGAAVVQGVSVESIVQDARRARAAAASAPPSPARSSQPPKPVETHADVILVDDNAELLAEAARRIAARGLNVVTVGSAKEGVQKLTGPSTGPHTVGVVDLVMPRVDGRGILGGLDLIRRVREKNPLVRLILATDTDNNDAEARARELGVPLVARKPAAGAVGAVPDLASFLDMVLSKAGRFDRSGSIDLGSELSAELGALDEYKPGPKATNTDLGRALEALRDMVGPVNDPERRDEIPLMVLRVASTSFGRAALFLVNEGDFVGLGGFGLDANGRDPGKALRDTHIPLDADTVLAAPVRERRATRVPFFESEWNRYLAERLGGPLPTECYVAPIICARQVEAVIYCDNAVDRRPMGDAQVLELFLTQAGAAMERAALEKRLVALEGTT